MRLALFQEPLLPTPKKKEENAPTNTSYDIQARELVGPESANNHDIACKAGNKKSYIRRDAALRASPDKGKCPKQSHSDQNARIRSDQILLVGTSSELAQWINPAPRWQVYFRAKWE